MFNLKKLRKRITYQNGRKETMVMYLPIGSDTATWERITRRYLQNRLPGLETLPSSKTAKVQTGFVEDIPFKIYIKSFYPRNRLEFLKHIFRNSRAYRDLKGILTARSRGLNVPHACCAVEIRKWGNVLSSIIITREVEDSVELRRLLEKLSRDNDFKTRRLLLSALAKELAEWHSAGIRHGDAREGNILCHANKNSGFNFCWIDNERSRHTHLERELLRNLVQLNMNRNGITRTDRIRFWKTYWKSAGHLYNRRSEETVMRKVIARTRKRWKSRGWL